MKKKHIAVSGYYGFDNFGDEAILKVLTKELKASGFDVTVISKNPQKTSENLCVNSVYTFAIADIVKTLKTSDVLVSGGGSLLQDVTSLKSLFYYLFVISAALILGKDVIIFAQGIGPINNWFGRFLTKLCLKKCKYITVRDEKSLKRLQEWGLNPVLVSDPVWNVETAEYSHKNKVGIQLRSWDGLDIDYLRALAVQVLAEFKDKEICIYSFQDALDLKVCELFKSILTELDRYAKVTVIPAMTIDETIQSFSKLDYLVAMRYHAVLLALKYGIPTYAISYDEKVEKIAKRFEIPYSNINDSDTLLCNFKQIFEIDTEKIKSKTRECAFDFEPFLNVLESINHQ